MWKLMLRSWRDFLCWYVIKVYLDIMIIPAFNIEKNFHKESSPTLESIPFKTSCLDKSKYIFMIFLSIVLASFHFFLLINSFHITNWSYWVIFCIIQSNWDIFFISRYVNFKIISNLSSFLLCPYYMQWYVNIWIH